MRQYSMLVWLTRKADGSKCKPFAVFTGAKQESKSLHEEIKRKSSVATPTNGWMRD